MFMMLLKHERPKHINKLPASELEIKKTVDMKHFKILEKIESEIIYPYRNKLSSKSICI